MRAGEEYAELSELAPPPPSGVGGPPPGGGGGGRWAEEALLDGGGVPVGGTVASGRQGRSSGYYSPPGTSYTIVERPASGLRHHRDVATGPGYGSPRGTYLGTASSGTEGSHRPSSRAAAAANNNKKRPISPEQVLRLFGSSSPVGGGAQAAMGRRSPASSPPSAAHRPLPAPSAGPPAPVFYGPPTLHELTTRTVTMMREPQDQGGHGFGICVKGGKDAGVGVYISRIEEGSVAERAGLRPGDSILEVNGTPFTGISHEEALKTLKSCRKISMTVRSPTLPMGNCAGPRPLRQTCSWIDRYGRPASPPLEYSRGHRFGYPRNVGAKDRAIRRVDLCIEPGQSLGLMIRGGVEYNLGIFITGVDKDSVADRAGLMIGDQILEVNGQSFMEVTHDEAVATLKYHKRMSLLVRDVGKVPHSCTAYDRDWDLCSPGSRVAATTRKWAAALQMVEEKARCLLPRPEFTSLCYYTDEYAARHMTIDAFVQVVTELLNTPEKYTLMTELREIVATEDRVKFDELVYRRDSEYSRIRDPREHDHRHSRRKGVPIPENNHAIYAGYHEDYGSESLPAAGYNEEVYRSASEDSGLGMGISDRNPRKHHGGKTVSDINDGDHRNQEYGSGDEENVPDGRNRRHSSPPDSRSGSTTALHQQDYADSELAHKLSRSFDMKDEQQMLDGGADGSGGGPGGGPGGGIRRHQSMQRLAAGPGERGEAGRVVHDEEGNLRVTVKKTKPILGIAIEGGANTKHPLPRIININENGAAYYAGGLEVGQLILRVDGQPVEGLQHQDIARLIAESFARRDRPDIEFLVQEAKKSNLEPKPTALVFLEA